MLTDEQLAEIERNHTAAIAYRNPPLSQHAHIAITKWVPALLADSKQLRAELAEREALANQSAAELRDAVEAVIEDGDSEVLAAMIVDRVVGPLAAEAKRWHDTYQDEVNARDEFFGHLLDLLPGAEDTGMDAYDQIPRAIEQLRAQVSGWSTAHTIVERAVRKGYDIGGIELDDLAKALGVDGGAASC